MVSFKTTNVTSEQPTSHCQVPGALRASLNHFHNYQANHSHRHEALSAAYRAPPPMRPPLSPPLPPPPPPPPSSSSSPSDPTVQRGCALHPRLEQPVTTSTPGMDSKKIVQATTAVVAVGQVRNKNNDASGVAASVSGIRRRSGPQGLRSPAAKRPLSAPVALQGWLHKQGSEGLMLWKKRWFVLSEYCLFYYKGPEEEKLLGSILLPSYRVTVCRPEDKVNRKFAFKAEHANMRTYHFAAESRESMNQWVNALTLATLLQDPSPGRGEAAVVIEIAGQVDGERSARPSVSSISSILNQSADDSDSGFHGFQSRDDPSHASNNNSSPNSVNTASFPNLNGSNGNGNAASNANNNNNLKDVQPVANGWVQQSPQYGQAGSSQHQHSQYGQLHPASQQLQQGHSHQHQAMLHQHQAHQNVPQVYLHKHAASQQKQQQQPQVHAGLSNVQTVQPMPRKFGQPIYANAPPKPRRLTDGSNEYSTPSPEPDYRKSPVSPDVTLTSKSPISDYDRNSVIYGTRMVQPSQQSLRTDKSGLNYGYCQAQATERRTPDTYGRSAKPRLNRGNGDYEEVYGIPQLYQRPAGPVVGYTKGSAPAPIPIPTYAQHQQMHQQQLHSPVTPPTVPIIRQPVAHQPPPRPHSADFLEYEATRRPQQQTPVQNEGSLGQQKRPQRPKSSLDIMNPSDATNDGYYYSEERYAAQMRQSAVYLHQTPQHNQQQRNQSLSRATVPSKTSTVHDKSDDIRMATLPDSSCSTLRRMQREHQQREHQQREHQQREHQQREHVHQQHAVPSQSLQRHNELANNDAKLRRSLREKVYETNARNTLTREYESSTGWNRPSQHSNHGIHMTQTCQTSHGGAKRWNEQQQFCRSASARLPRSRHPAALDQDEDDYGERSSEQDSRDGERKIQQREESMKRLLEWKQRMLQSPLTRKPSGSANRGRAQNELSNYYKQQALLDLAAHEASVTEARHSRRREDSHRSHVRSKSTDGRRTVTSVSRYNSYSSDDEEMGDVRRKRTRRPSHAGRSPRHAGDDRTSTAPTQDNSKIIQGSIRGNVPSASSNQSVKVSFRSCNDSKIPSNAMSTLPLSSSIPPDAGYEEISFPPTLREACPDSYYISTEKKPAKKAEHTESTIISEAQRKHQMALMKKPAGILKSPTVYEAEEQSTTMESNETDNLNDYVPTETWHVQKNVQWNSNEDKEEWDSNIDESKFIKEFSYQYIKPKQAERGEQMEDNLNKTETTNLVQSRIRSYESNTDSSSPVKEMLTMQEALKSSPVETAEAHVSRLDSSKKTSSIIRNFALGDNGVQENIGVVKNDGHVKQASTDSNKSVKDLLADFERKSQQVRLEERDRQSEVTHRGVFSDTETLLYDTGSDLDQRDKSEEREEQQQGEPDQNQTASESSRNMEAYLGTLRRKKASPMRQRRNKSPDSIEQSIPNEDLAIDPMTNCERLSVTESLLTHVDRFSADSDTTSTLLKQEDTTPEEHYLPMSPRKAILDPNDDDRPNPKMMESLFANLDHEESSYVEMAQNSVSHSLLAPSTERNDRDSGDYSTLDASHYEFVCVSDSKMEPVYMEVSQLSEKEEKDDDKMYSKKQNINEDSGHTRSDLPDILTALKSDSSDADDESSKDLDSIDAPRHPRFSLSDTFRPASYYLGASRTMIAELHDSSDSELVSPPPIPTSPPPLEELDCLDMQDSLEVKKVSPQVAVMKENISSTDSPKSWNRSGHGESQRSPSRFSEATISSTFRDSRISLESASGSDSVELRNPEEEARHRQMKRRPVSDEVCEVLDSLDELESLGSRFDGTSIDLDQYLEELQARDAFNVDLYAKDLSYNSIYGFNENMMVVDKLQKTTCHDLPRKMNMLSFGQPLRHDSRNKIGSASSLPSMRVCDVPPSHQHSQSFTGDTHYENISSFSPLRNSPAIRSESEQSRDENRRLQRSFHDTSAESHHSRDSSYSMGGARSLSGQSSTHSPMGSISSGNHGNNLTSNLLQTSSYGEQKTLNHSTNESMSQEPIRYPFLPKHRSPPNFDHVQRPSSSTSVKTNSHSRSYLSSTSEQRPQNDQPGAPYYYSDLRASSQNNDNDKPIGGHVSRLPQLNNQRDDASAMNKRNDIGRIINPIARQVPRQIQVEGIDEARRIAAELRKTTCQLLGDTKVDLVDKRNFYEADTLRRVKSTDPLPDTSLPEVSTRNLYPHGLRDKSNSQLNENMTVADTSLLTQASHRRSRSLEGLLDDVGLQSIVEQRNRANRLLVLSSTQTEERARTVPSAEHRSPSATNDFNVEDPWEQDSLWRENLRRASLRNARSLDNLDNPTRSAGSSSCPDNKTRARITRGATYVNDSVAVRRDNDSSSSERPPRVKRRINKEDSILDDRSYLSESRQVIANPPDVAAYTWDSQNEVYRKDSPDELNHFLAEGNLPSTQMIPEDPSTCVGSRAASSGTTSASFELDREKLRQWDLLSSACLLQEQQQISTVDSGRGLPTAADRVLGDVMDSKCVPATTGNSITNTGTTTTTTTTTTTMTTTATTSTVTMTTMTTMTTMATMTPTLTTSATTVTKALKMTGMIHSKNDAIPFVKHHSSSSLETSKRREAIETKDSCNRATASGSGSVIGRDPLPPRAVSTSHLAERTLTQPPAVETTLSSTLPLPRSSGGHRQQQQHLPIHRSSPQQQQQQQQQEQQRQQLGSQILRASSNGDIGTNVSQTNNNEMKDYKVSSPSGHQTQRLHASTGHLRVMGLNDHRISSPSDNEIQVHSPIERKVISPIGMLDSHRGGVGGGSVVGGNIRGNQRVRDSAELQHIKSNANLGQRLGLANGSPTAAVTTTATSTPTTTPAPTPTLSPTLTPTQGGANDLVRVSAGELLGRTHEELVLLLIQLRRQNATLLKAMDNCHMEIEAQARLAEFDIPRRLENLQRLEELKNHLMDLEKQYEKGKPLVNLVDNMVKLGSLYNRNANNGSSSVTTSRHDLFQENTKNHRDRLEFNQRVQEQRLLAEERRDWDRLSPDHGQLQAKVQQLYKLDRLLQEESGTLQSLQQDKEILEKALGGLRHKLQGSRSNLVEAERYRKQQLLLERELSRVRVLLAHNSKVKPVLSQKLEETVAENARLEQDLVVLRQKLQASRRYAGNMTRDTSGTTAPLETELRRVQQLVGDLQRQRKELSVQVQQLTEKSHSLVQQIRPQPSPAPPVHQSKKRTQNSWLETDLDSGVTLDHGLDSPVSPSLLPASRGKQNESSYHRYTSPTQHKKSPSPSRQQHIEQPFVQSPQNHISAISPQLREQIQQHQLKQQLLKDQMQGKGSLLQMNVAPLYVNTESRVQDTNKSNESGINQINGGPNAAPEYIPPPPPPPLNEETSLTNDNYRQSEDNKFAGLLHNREKQEIKTVRIVKRESERRQRDRGDRTGNIGIPLTNGLQAPGGAKRLSDDDIAGSQKFEKAQLGRVVEETPIAHAQSTVHLTDLDDVQFQRSMSLPRGFGGQRHHPNVHHAPIAPPPRSDSMHALRTIMMRRHKVKFENHDGSSDSTLSPYIDSPTSSSQMPMSSPNYSTSPPYSPSHQNYHHPGQSSRGFNQQTQQPRYYSPHPQYGQYDSPTSFVKSSVALSPEPMSPNNLGVPPDRSFGSIGNVNNTSESPQLSPVFKSEAAKQIIKEVTEKKVDGPRRRQVPKEKRRHYTVSSSKPVLDLEDSFSRMGMGRARDDLDMERALRPRINAPDVVRSTLSHKELKYNESTIDQLLGTPNKIVIPERYIPEQTPELTAEEQEHRSKKAEAIRKMLSETAVTAPDGNDDDVNLDKSDTLKRKVVEEKRQRNHILQLNQILAKQVMEKSKMVAVKALATLPLKTETSIEDEDLSPVTPLPLYQQRENYYS